MARGTDYFNCKLVRSRFTDELLIADVDEKMRNAIDGHFTSDNGFRNSNAIPGEPGLYEVNCMLEWCDSPDPDAYQFDITILSILNKI